MKAITPKKIYAGSPEIKKKVYEDYPVTKKEKSCSIERRKREILREERAKRYYDDEITARDETKQNGSIQYETKG